LDMNFESRWKLEFMSGFSHRQWSWAEPIPCSKFLPNMVNRLIASEVSSEFG
jgi:hypothetical protein